MLSLCCSLWRISLGTLCIECTWTGVGDGIPSMCFRGRPVRSASPKAANNACTESSVARSYNGCYLSRSKKKKRRLLPFTPFLLDGIKERGSVGGEGHGSFGTGETGRIVINQQARSRVGEIWMHFSHLCSLANLLCGVRMNKEFGGDINPIHVGEEV